MRVMFKDAVLAMIPETDAEREAFAAWRSTKAGHVFALTGADGTLHDIGDRDDACREPININTKARKPLDLISNVAATRFELDGEDYASVEGFWQGLKFADLAERRRVAALSGSEAKDAGGQAPASDLILYGDEVIRTGTWNHWRLMERACEAKFGQHERARAALLSTGERPLIHQMRQDSRTIPGVIMAQIWMRIREQLRG
jgi:predicted NAD-dependent protein-ADP-ribosyltransferase YbiA (DUF1768 family)